MKKNLLLVLIFTALTVATSAQNTYFNIINAPTSGGRFVIPHNTSFDVLTTNSRTFTFRIMVPIGTANNASFSKIFTKGDSPSTTGTYGLTFGSSTTVLPHKDIRVLDHSSVDKINYGNTSNTTVVFGSLNDGNWHHVAVVFNDNSDLVVNSARRSKVFFDGAYVGYASNTTNPKTGAIEIANIENIIFGSSANGGSSISAAFDDIRIWDHSLTLAEVEADKTAEINATNAPSTLGLLAAYDFESSTLVTAGGVPDITGKTSAGQALKNNSTSAFATGSSTPTLANKQFNTSFLKVHFDAATDMLDISAPEANAAISVMVYDMSGRIIATSKSNDTTAKISLSNVSSGVYLVNLTDGFTAYTQKIIKK